jgi:hypothetical protein
MEIKRKWQSRLVLWLKSPTARVRLTHSPTPSRRVEIKRKWQSRLVLWPKSPTARVRLTPSPDFFASLQSMFDFSAEDLEARQYPTVSPDRWIPKAIELTELIKRLATKSGPVGDQVTTHSVGGPSGVAGGALYLQAEST